jgi:hypothetical protein
MRHTNRSLGRSIGPRCAIPVPGKWKRPNGASSAPNLVSAPLVEPVRTPYEALGRAVEAFG